MLFNWFQKGNILRTLLAEMLNELEGSCFEVVLVPANPQKHSNHCLRALQYANPRWYSEFAGLYKNCRGIGRKRMKRARTFIKKTHTINALRRMIAGGFTGTYAERLLDYVKPIINRKYKTPVEELEYDPAILF